VAAASGLIISALWWQLTSAKAEADEQRERAGALRSQIDQVTQTAKSNADMATELAAEITRRDEILNDYAERLEQRREQTARLMTELQEANRAAPAEYQACLRVPLPGSVSRILRVGTDAGEAARDRDPDRAGEAASDAVETLPGA